MSIFGMFGGGGVNNLNADEFAEGMKNNPEAVLIDVRTEMEFEMGHIPGATLADISGPGFRQTIESMDKNKHYYVYCRSGSRSAHAVRMMSKLGFEHTYNLARGIIGWQEPLVTDEQVQNRK